MTSLTAPRTFVRPAPALAAWFRAAVSWQDLAVCLLSFSAAGVFTWLSVAQHLAYNTHAYDLSWFDQLAWNTARGHWLSTSFSHGTYLKEHFSPALLVLGLVYRFWRGPTSLLTLQGTVAAAAAVPLYFGVTRALSSRTAGLLLAIAYLISPHLHGAILFDFHPDALAVFFIFLSFALLAAGRPGPALLALLPAFLVKEDVGLVGIGLALIFWLAHYRRHAWLLLCGSLLSIVFAESVIVLLPHLLHWGASGEDGRYTYVFHGGVQAPLLLWRHLTGTLQEEALAYFYGSQAFLSLAGVGALVSAPDVLANVLADHKPQLQLTLQYPLFPLALSLLGATINIRVLGHARRLAPVWARAGVPREWRAALLAGCVLLAESCSFLIGSPLGLHVHAARFETSAHTAALNRIVALVPKSPSVSAQSSILPHLSERENIREFPYLDGAAYVVIDRKGFVAWDADVAGYASVLASLPERGYCRIASSDGVELWAVDDRCEAP